MTAWLIPPNTDPNHMLWLLGWTNGIVVGPGQKPGQLDAAILESKRLGRDLIVIDLAFDKPMVVEGARQYLESQGFRIQ